MDPAKPTEQTNEQPPAPAKPEGRAGVKRERFGPKGRLALAKKAWGDEFEILMAITEQTPSPPFALLEGGLGVVDIRGPLVNRAHWAWDSYEAIGGRVDAAFDCADVRTVCMRINSPGGDVDGCFDFVRQLRAMALRHGKPLIAFVDGQAASAAYAIASAAVDPATGETLIWIPPTGFAGSIGIIETLADVTERDRAEGVRFEMIVSGARKADGNPHVAISSSAVSAMQTQVDGLADLFFALVSEMRGPSADWWRDLEASMTFGERAVALALADRVVTWSQVVESFQALARTARSGPMPKYLDEAKRAVKRAIAEGDDEESKQAKKMLDALEEGEPDGGAPPERKKEGEGTRKGEGEGEGTRAEGEGEGEDEGEGEYEGKRAAAEGEDDEKKEDEIRDKAKRASAAAKKADADADAEGEGEGKKAKRAAAAKLHAQARAEWATLRAFKAMRKTRGAQAAAPDVELTRRVQTLEAERARERDDRERSALLATRPDFTEEVRAKASTWPLEILRDAVKTFPRIMGPAGRPLTHGAAALSAAGGASHGTPEQHLPPVDAADARHIDRAMGFARPAGAIKTERNTLELGVMSSEDAAKRVKEIEDEMKKGAA